MAKTYANIIMASINDFNSIYNAMKAKSVVNDQNEVLTTDMVVPTADYSTLIKNQLYRVGQRNGSVGAPANTNGVIADHGPLTITNYNAENVNNFLQAPSTTTLDENKAVLSFGRLRAGYYDANPISLEIPLTDYTLTATTSSSYDITTQGDQKYYHVVGKDKNLIGSVDVIKGTAALSFGNDNPTKNDLSASIIVDPTTEITAEIVAAGDTTTEGYNLVLNKSASYDGAIEVTANVAVTEGYIKSGEVTGNTTKTVQVKAKKENVKETIKIKKGSIEVTGLNGAALDISATGGVILSDSELPGGYEISGSASNLQIDSTITEGYFKSADTISGSVDINGKKWLAKGSATLTNVNVSPVFNLGEITPLTDINTEGYTISVTGNQSFSTTVNEGYIKSTEKSSATASVNGSVKIAKGSVSGSITSIVTAEETITGMISESDTGYSIKLKNTLNGANNISNTEGYIKSANVKVTATPAPDQTVYIKAGSTSLLSPTLTSQFVCKNAGEHATTPMSMSLYSTVKDLESVVGSGVDYYALVLNSGYSVVSGYQPTVASARSNVYVTDNGEIKTDDNGTPSTAGSAIYYMPLATFEYVEGDNANKFIQVKKGGYVPSGALTDLGGITGPIDYAAVQGTLSGVEFATGDGEGYALSIAKNVTDAGYIGSADGQGSLTLNASTARIKKGSVTASTSRAPITQGTITLNEAKTKYLVPFTSSFTSTVTLGEGYIKPADITISGYKRNGSDFAKTEDNNGSLELNKATFSASATVSEISVKNDAASTTVMTATSGDFYLTTQYTGTATASVTEGYTVGDSFNRDIGGTSSKIYLQEGSVSNISVADGGSGTVSAPTGFTKSAGKYTGSFNVSAITVQHTIGEGYIKSNATGGIESNTISLNDKKISIDPASVRCVHSATATLEATDSSLVLADSIGSDTDDSYLAIKATPSGITCNDTITAGYLGDGSEIICSEGTLTSVTKYIKKVGYTPSSTEVVDYYLNNDSNKAKKTSVVYSAGTLGSTSKYVCDDNGSAVATASIASMSDNASVTGLRNSVYIDTTAKYATKDIQVTLTADAMGTDVVAELAKLQRRMSGVYAV